MSKGDIHPMQMPIPAGDKQPFDRRITAIAVLGSILAAGLVAAALAGSNAARPDRAAHSIEAPELRAAEIRAERSGVLSGYEILF
jgi:hypothetical protein